jgi:CAAX prenyl protease-like protein
VCNRDLIWPYLLPYGAYVLVGSIGGLPRPVDYALRIVVVGALLFAFRSRYQRITGPKSSLVSILVGVIGGVVAALLWVGLLLPFQDAHKGTAFDLPSFVMRLAAASLVVPFAEELLCRGFILGLITQWQEARRAGGSIDDVLDDRSVQEITPGAWTPLAVALSSAAFAIGHSPSQMLAAFGFGVAMSALWIIRRDLLTPIIAHAITNFVLYTYVFATSSWGLW